jgi:hypothetical protein
MFHSVENLTSTGEHGGVLLSKFVTKLPPLEKTYVWDPKQLLFDESKLKKALECLIHPGATGGDFSGHICIGLIFLNFNLYMAWVVFSRYFKSIAPGSKYKFHGVTTRVTWANGWPLAYTFLGISAIYLSISEFTPNLNY